MTINILTIVTILGAIRKISLRSTSRHKIYYNRQNIDGP